MSGPDRPLFNLEITEDATTGIAIRLRHAGQRPDVLAGIPKDVLRRARPWLWNSYERRVLKKAQGMSYESYRIVRDTLLLERARMVMAARPQAKGPPRLSWLERRRLARAHNARIQDMAGTDRETREVVVREVGPPRETVVEPSPPTPTLTEQMRQLTGTALSAPAVHPPRSRSR